MKLQPFRSHLCLLRVEESVQAQQSRGSKMTGPWSSTKLIDAKGHEMIRV